MLQKRFCNVFILLSLLLLIGSGHVLASSTYYSALKATGGKSGVGYVYASTSSTTTPVWNTEVTSDSQSSSTSGQSDTYYAWAKPCRGSVFKSWTSSVNSVAGDANPYTVTVLESTSDGKTNTGTLTANWIVYKPCTVHLHSSADGTYSVKYAYTDYDETSKSFVDYTPMISVGSDGDHDVNLYYTDTITLTVNSGDFLGWYKDAAFTQTLDTLTGTGPYTLKVPANTSANTELDVYPKFKVQSKLFGKLNVKYAYASADGAGQIAITDVSDATPTYSSTECSLSHISFVDDSSTPVAQNYYLHAQSYAVSQYAFAGWYSSQTPSKSTLLSTDAQYTYSFDASSTNSATPTEKTVYALFVRISAHYFEMIAEPGTAGLGMTYVSQSKETNPSYSVFSNYSKLLAEEIYLADRAVSTNIYLYAKPKYGYQFDGWYSDAACTTKVSADNPYTYTASITSTDPNNPDKAHLYAKFVKASQISVTFAYPSNGAYTAKTIDIVENADGEYVWGETSALYNSASESADKTIQMYPTSDLFLTAVPNSGYAVKSWTIAGTAVTSGSNNYTTAVTAGKTYGVTFGASLPFQVGSTTYATLDAAIANLGSNTQITVVEDAVVQAGNYTIPSGVTLLIPYESTGKVSTTTCEYGTAGTVSLYRKLKMVSGAKIMVNGALCVNSAGVVAASGGTQAARARGAYGQIDMEEGSEIDIESGANLYSWGYITGKGNVIVKSGAKLYEPLQFDFRGGSHTSAVLSSVLPLNQYYVQNIEAHLRVYAGAQETVFTAITVTYIGDQTASAKLIASDGMFVLNSGAYLERYYDGSTDRIIYDVYGSAALSGITVKVYIYSMDSKSVVLPLTNNMTIRIHSGTTAVNYATELLADARIEIDEDAVLDVQNNFFVYDRDEWVGKTCAVGGDLNAVTYAPGRTYKSSTATSRTGSKMVDAAVLVNGTLQTSSSGYLYTTAGKANIYSAASGKVVLANGAGTKTSTLQNVGVAQTTQSIPVTPSQLKNGDGTYTSTEGDAANTTYTYFLERWCKNLTVDGCFVVDDYGHRYLDYDGKYIDVVASSIYTAAWVSRDAASVLYIHTANDCNWTKVNIVANTTTYLKDDNEQYYEYNSTKGFWIPATQYTVTFQNYKNKTIHTCTIFPNEAPTYTGPTPYRPSDESGEYIFIGWKRVDDATIYASDALPSLSANTTFVAQFSSASSAYIITWDAATNGGSTTATTTSVTTGSAIGTLPTASKTGYTFLGWFTAATDGTQISATTIPTTSTTYYAQFKVITYTITYNAGTNGTGTVAAGTKTYGVAATLSSSKFTRTGYTQTGWSTTDGGAKAYDLGGSYTANAAITLYPFWTANTNTAYTVKHYQENLDGTYPSSPTETQNLTGTTATSVTPAVKTYEGFTSPATQTVTIAADGSTIVIYKYTRNSYTLTVIAGEGGTVTGGGTYTYGTSVSLTATPNSGYAFSQWSDGSTDNPYVVTVSGDATYTAAFIATEVGDPLDIADWTGSTITLNLNGVPAAGWPYTINGVVYQKTDRAADRTLTIPYTGSADDELEIKMVKTSGDIYSLHKYIIPLIVTTNTSLSGTTANSVVFVKEGAKLTVSSTTSLDKIVVAPNAELVVNSGVTLTLNTLLLRTTAWKAAILDNNGTIAADKTYYTRIVADNSKYLQFALPLASNVSNVTLSSGSKCTYNTSWILKSYSESSRAANGAVNNETTSNWVAVADGGVIEASKGYEIYSNTPYYREFYFPVTLPSSEPTTVAVSRTEGGAAGEAHAGWNALCSPMTRVATVSFGTPSEAIKVCLLNTDGVSYTQTIPSAIYPAVPFYYQAAAAGDLNFVKVSAAPRRSWNTEVSEQWLRLTVNDEDGAMLDETNIFTHPEKFSVDYEAGYDVAKQSPVAGKASLYSTFSCGNLAFAAIPDSIAQTRIPLTLYTAEAKDYVFTLESNAFMGRMDYVFLHDTQTGAVIDLLSGNYTTSVSDGTTSGRFYLQCVYSDQSSKIATDIEETNKENNLRKILYHDVVYIIRDGVVYDLTGRRCEMK